MYIVRMGDDDAAVLQHFVQYGMNEGRQAKVDFSVQNYRTRYQDLQKTYGSDWKAYCHTISIMV